MSLDPRLWTTRGVLAPARIEGIDGERVYRLGVTAEDLFLATELASLVWKSDRDDSPTPERRTALVRILLALLTLVREGNTCLPLPPHPAFERTLAELGAPTSELRESRQLIERVQNTTDSGELRELLGNDGDFRPLILHNEALHLHCLRGLERALARRIVSLLRGGSPTDFDSDQVRTALEDLQNRPYHTPSGDPVELSLEQVEAVRATTRSHLHCITGGPGTGKTSIVVSILRLFRRLFQHEDEPMRVALAAPTGKAADRMGSSIAKALRSLPSPSVADRRLQHEPPTSQTLHRLLGAHPGRRHYRYHEHFPLPYSLIILDEASMVDLRLFERLLAALPPQSTLILLGDADQLPSVEPGSVFRDLVAMAPDFGHVTSLTHSYRQSHSASEGVDLLAVAKAIRNEEELDRVLGGRRARASDLLFQGYERILPLRPNDLDLFLEEWYLRVARPAELETLLARTYTTEHGGWNGHDEEHLTRLFEHEESYRLLVPTHGAQHGRGTVGLNRWFRRRLSSGIESRFLRVGEPVLMSRNDPNRQLHNGDLGLILRVRPRLGDKGQPMAVFRVRGTVVAFELASIQESLVPAWALTVHKAQGSEYDRVALVLPVEPNRAVRQELVYTAVTRARNAVVVVAGDEVLGAAIARRSERFSGLQAELQAALGTATSSAEGPDARTSSSPKDEPPEAEGRQLSLF